MYAPALHEWWQDAEESENIWDTTTYKGRGEDHMSQLTDLLREHGVESIYDEWCHQIHGTTAEEEELIAALDARVQDEYDEDEYDEDAYDWNTDDDYIEWGLTSSITSSLTSRGADFLDTFVEIPF